MSRSLVFAIASLSVGCFSPEVPLETDGPSSDTDDLGTDSESGRDTDPTSDSGTGNGPGGTMESGDPTSDSDTDPSGETDPQGDDPPVIEEFSVNDSQTPEDVTQSSIVRLSAEVSDDVGVAGVEFFDGETPLGTATASPYDLDVLVTSTDSGGHVYTARVTDNVGQEATSDEVQLFVDVTGGEIIDINEGLFEGCVFFFNFGGITQVAADRYVLAGTGCEDGGGDFTPPTVVAVDESLEVLSTTTVEGSFAMPPTTLDDGTALVPSLDILTGIWRYNAFDPNIGEIDSGAGLLYSRQNGSPAAITLPSTGVFVVQGGDDVALLEPDLDAETWTAELGLGTESGFVRARAVAEDLSVYVLVDSDDCPGEAEACLVKFSPRGNRVWTRGLQNAPQYGGIVPDGADGVFYGLRIPNGSGYLIAHVNGEGDELSSELLTFATSVSSSVRLAPDGTGGVVISGALGEQDPNTGGEVSTDVSLLMRLDANLQEVWRVDGLGPGQSRGVALARDSAGTLLVAGIRATEEPPNLIGIFGDVWIGRVNL